MYPAVPTSAVARSGGVSPLQPAAGSQSPKSQRSARNASGLSSPADGGNSRSSSRLEAERSRCTNPDACTLCSPCATSRKSEQMRASSRKQPRSRCRRTKEAMLPASQSCISTKRVSSGRPWPSRCGGRGSRYSSSQECLCDTTFGWKTRSITWTSRSTASSCCSSPHTRTRLTAYSPSAIPSSRCVHRQTAPKLPSPILARSTKKRR
mmetsp:Transcript_15807/g.50697  ORF Transcript_15807/g.50697 Transcript_15807/m.50697 type:complete len:208 (-) Transcript_15807:389-1012(-)